jgi:hypothetical protein
VRLLLSFMDTLQKSESQLFWPGSSSRRGTTNQAC